MNIELMQNYQKEFLQFYRSQGKSENSLKCYRLDFRCFNDYLSHRADILEKKSLFDQAMTQEFEGHLGIKYQNINSIRRKLQTLRLFFDFLIKKEIVSENPIKTIHSAPKVLYPPKLHTLEEIEHVYLYLIHKMTNASSAKEKLQYSRNLIIFLIIFYAGPSVSILGELKKQDILRGNFLNSNGENLFQLRLLLHPKRRDAYSIPLPKELEIKLTHYQEILDQEMNKDQFFFEELFFNSNAYKLISGGLSPRGLEDIFHKMSEILKLEMTPKSLRQTCILRWIALGIEQTTIKEWLGVAPSYSLILYQNVFELNQETCNKLKSFNI